MDGAMATMCQMSHWKRLGGDYVPLLSWNMKVGNDSSSHVPFNFSRRRQCRIHVKIHPDHWMIPESSLLGHLCLVKLADDILGQIHLLVHSPVFLSKKISEFLPLTSLFLSELPQLSSFLDDVVSFLFFFIFFFWKMVSSQSD